MIWSSRNKTVHEGRQLRGFDIAEKVRRYLKEIEGLKAEPLTRYGETERDSPILGNGVWINFDSSYSKDLG